MDGRADLAEQVRKLFTEVLPGDAISVGMVDFERNLARARVADLERSDPDHGAPHLEIERAMIVTLTKNGIVLPQSFMHVMDGFKPKYATQ